ncbi:MAG: hypothetical protein GY757_55515, partial [bacterium]|nr:hypothetical protein [bacterium]
LYRTGDLARWLPDGTVEFFGRIDHQVKIRGFRIELNEIENKLLTHENIKKVVVIAKENSTGDKYLCAYAEEHDQKKDGPPDAAEPMENTGHYRDYLSQNLPEYMVPAYFVILDKIPLTTTGKIDRRALPKHKIAATGTYNAPRDEKEEKLAAIWTEILFSGDPAPPHIGIDDNFFHMGGHSLKGTVLMSGIYREFNIKLSLKEFFKTPTIRGLKKKITAASQETHGTYGDIQPTEKKEYYPLTPAQKRMYILYRMEQGRIGYNIPNILRLEKEADPEKLEKAFRQLIQRHEILRTTFHMVKEEPVQKIHPE